MKDTRLQPFYLQVGEMTGSEVHDILSLAQSCGAEGYLYILKVIDGYVDLDSHLYFGVDYNLEVCITEDPANFGINPLDNITKFTKEEANIYLKSVLELNKQEDEEEGSMKDIKLKPFCVEVGDYSEEAINHIFKLAVKCGATWAEHAGYDVGEVEEIEGAPTIHYTYKYFGIDCDLETYFYGNYLHYVEFSQDDDTSEISIMTYQEAEDYLLSVLEEAGDSTSDPTPIEEPTEDVVDLTNTFVLIKDKEHCEVVQEYLFNKGYTWQDGGEYYLQLYSEGKISYIFTNEGELSWGCHKQTNKKTTEILIDYKKAYDFIVTFKEDEKVKELQEKLKEVKELADKIQQEIDELQS